jgi:hypothetical protein
MTINNNPRPNKINLNQDSLTIQQLLDLANSWNTTDASELTSDQLAILSLKRIIEGKSQLGGGATPVNNDCFICATGA